MNIGRDCSARGSAPFRSSSVHRRRFPLLLPWSRVGDFWTFLSFPCPLKNQDRILRAFHENAASLKGAIIVIHSFSFIRSFAIVFFPRLLLPPPPAFVASIAIVTSASATDLDCPAKKWARENSIRKTRSLIAVIGFGTVFHRSYIVI